MGKRVLSLFVFVVLGIFMIGFVSAQSEPVKAIQGFFEGLYEILTPVVELFVGDASDGDGDLVIAKLLIAIVLLVFIWIAASNIPGIRDSKWAVAIVSIVVAILASRFLGNSELVQTIILPYSAFGVAVSSLLPLVLYFWFVQENLPTRMMRKVAWIFAAVVFFGLWTLRRKELDQAAWWYIIAFVACIVFLFADGTIRKAWRKNRAENLVELRLSRLRSDVMDKRRELENRLLNGSISKTDYNTQDKHLKKLEAKYDIK